MIISRGNRYSISVRHKRWVYKAVIFFCVLANLFFGSLVSAEQQAKEIVVPNDKSVDIRHFRWFPDDDGKYSFSIYNKSKVKISNVEWVVVLYDADGLPFDICSGLKEEDIPPGLARMVHGKCDSSSYRFHRKAEVKIIGFLKTIFE